MNLGDIIKIGEKELAEAKDTKRDALKNLLQRLYFNLDIYSSTLIYIWMDDNRIKISMDGFKHKFCIKHNTKFSNKNSIDIEFKKYIETSIIEFLGDRGICIYNFFMDDSKVIFKIKAFKKITEEQCLR